ncbi:hypothetical protein L1987_56340 [Smallanthus sonchifolius]|uniref:Uncharacterized protein n=1 Tax=Smallanthus sonchifolius TaxID=185202 RepID=A0ACB9EC34_9ASTR|nr:hypothetical protein L1987_56340 [Smallanthus sonchifolius]
MFSLMIMMLEIDIMFRFLINSTCSVIHFKIMVSECVHSHEISDLEPSPYHIPSQKVEASSLMINNGVNLGVRLDEYYFAVLNNEAKLAQAFLSNMGFVPLLLVLTKRRAIEQ